MMTETTEISTQNLKIALGQPESEIAHSVMHGSQTLKTPAGVEVE